MFFGNEYVRGILIMLTSNKVLVIFGSFMVMIMLEFSWYLPI